MKLITDQDLRTVLPADLHYYDRLNEGQAETYRYLSSAYRRLLNAYVAFMGVGKYDIALRENARVVVPVPEREQDLYQRYANVGLQYFYVRNNVYVERLAREELRFLRSRLQERNILLDYDSCRFVEDTYAKVIREVGADAGDTVWYGPRERRFGCPWDALVVGCRVAEGQGRDELADALRCCQLLGRSLGERLGVPASVVLYDASSVKALP